MGNTWKLQDAKNQFSQVVETAIQKGPQVVQRRGKKVAVILSVKDYEKLVRPKTNLTEFFRKSPLYGVRLNLDRDRDTGREISL